ncbi:MAG: NUDIX domain-containing protein [Luteitalea sp.]|nr:NUDIX domain-containing protein [Luteitalea sp.]
MTELIVAAAVIERDGRFLVTRRQAGVHLAGAWEFPGGKCNANEPLRACLAREILEELAVDIDVGAEILQTSHRYDDRQVELHFFRCGLRGEPTAALGQEMRWVPQGALLTLAFPPADAELIRLLMANDRLTG